MGLPEIFISFETAAVSAIQRSARGVVCLLLADTTQGGEAVAVYETLSEVPKTLFTAENYRTISLAFKAAPKKIIVMRGDEANQAALEKLTFDWLAAPAVDADEVSACIKALRGKGKSVKEAMDEVGAVVEGYYATESAMQLAQKTGVEMPIVAAVDAVVKGEMSAEESVERLMRREQKPEKPEQK